MDNGTPKTKGFPYIRARFIIHKFEIWIVESRSAIYAELRISGSGSGHVAVFVNSL